MKELAKSQLESWQVSSAAEYVIHTQCLISMTLLFVHVLVLCEQKLAKKTKHNAYQAHQWTEASRVEPPLNLKTFYDNMVKTEDPTNSKIMLYFKRLTEMSLEEYKSLPAKTTGQVM